MRNFSTTIDIAAPAETVWTVMTAVERWHEWTPSINSVKLLGDRPFGVGARVRISQPGLPPALWSITSIEPGRSFTWTSVGPGFRAVATHAVEPTATGSHVTLSIEFLGLLGGLFGRMTKSINKRYIDFEAKGLKARSEHPDYRHSRMV